MADHNQPLSREEELREEYDAGLDGGDEPEPEEGDEGICIHCNGSGEGMYDGTTCRWCKGTGESK